MTKLNPYEPSRVTQPARRRVAKKTIGLTAVLLLTPVAVAIAALGSCGITFVVVDSIPMNDYAAAFAIGWLVFLLPPITAFVGMMFWARREHRAKKPQRDASSAPGIDGNAP